jgi:hypothetical protein
MLFALYSFCNNYNAIEFKVQEFNVVIYVFWEDVQLVAVILG